LFIRGLFSEESKGLFLLILGSSVGQISWAGLFSIDW
jgi:hypothetical protein